MKNFETRVLHDEMLAAHRPQPRIGHELAGADPGAVDNDRGLLSDLGQ